MPRRLLQSVLIALALATTFHVSLAAKPPVFLACALEDGTELLIAIDNFGGMREAVHHCLDFWHGRPAGVER
jgi:DNA-binding LacI/PurR family transcriptional regulator